MTFFAVLTGVLLGAVTGSFLTCAWWRLPRRITMNGRSVCPACRRELKARWNIPVLGWLALRGRAGCCGARIPARYPLIETAAATTGALLGLAAGPGAVWATTIAVTALIAAASLASARHDPGSPHIT